MGDSGAILCHISSLKAMLDKVNDEIEENIQITREIESEIVKCEEIETALTARESELTKLLYLSQFELTGLLVVAAVHLSNVSSSNIVDGEIYANSRNSVVALLEEVNHQRRKKDDLIERLNKKREDFTKSCVEFQKSIESDETNELRALLLEEESLDNEIHRLEQTNTSVTNSVSAFLEEILEDLRSSNAALEAEIEIANAENEQVLKHIDELKATIFSTVSQLDDPW